MKKTINIPRRLTFTIKDVLLKENGGELVKYKYKVDYKRLRKRLWFVTDECKAIIASTQTHYPILSN